MAFSSQQFCKMENIIILILATGNSCTEKVYCMFNIIREDYAEIRNTFLKIQSVSFPILSVFWKILLYILTAVP